MRAADRYRIGVCDWMILKRQRVGAFALAHELGADGVEVDMGPLGTRVRFENQLTNEAVCAAFLDAARTNRLEICSVAMSGFYAQSFVERSNVIELVRECIETMQRLNVRVAFLPLGVPCDLMKHPELRPEVVRRLRQIAPMAEQAGVVIGIETSLPAEEEARLLDEVGSPAIRSYFNFANAIKHGRDVCRELRTLGRDRICQIHCTNEDGELLENDPKLDLRKIKATLDEQGWSGWLVVERSRDARNPRDVKYNFGSNIRFLKSVFAPGRPGPGAGSEAGQ